MTHTEPRSGLPVEFLRAVVADAGPGSPPTRMAIEHARTLPGGPARDELLLALLQGALADTAPGWVLEAAVDSDLEKDDKPYPGASLNLASAALSHPSCTDALREKSLRRCSVPQLAIFGRNGCTDALAEAVVAELRQRGQQGQPMTPDLLDEPCPAQLVLREPLLHDAVFAAALDLLPTFPYPSEIQGQDADTRFDAYMAARKSWETMWERVVTVHTSRHRQLIDWARDSAADHEIRKHLLGTIPWDVEPSLLEEIALEHLGDFNRSVLITRLSRMSRDGLSEQEARASLTGELDALAPKSRQIVERYSEDWAEIREYGCDAAVSWMESAAGGTWRYILNPSEAKSRYGEPHTWQASDDLLSTLSRRFASVAVRALQLWEPDPDTTYRHPRDLRWLHAMLLHLPKVTDEVEDKVRAVVRHARPASRSRWQPVDFTAREDERRLAEILTAIERIIGDPATVARKAALGDPGQVTVGQLAAASAEVLDDYLTRHAGDDVLVEKALPSFASSHYRAKLSFSDVLARHSAPHTALLRITTDLRRRLGGNPSSREAWTRQILALPDCGPELIRALPAWTALTVGGTRYRSAHQAVTAVVMNALGDDDKAWSRFASSPASYSGPNAWLRLGDILDASVKGTAWPKPPASK